MANGNNTVLHTPKIAEAADKEGGIGIGVWIGMGSAIFISVVGVLIAVLAMRERRKHRHLRRRAADLESGERGSRCPAVRGGSQKCTSAIPLTVISSSPPASPPVMRQSRDATAHIYPARDSVATNASGPYAEIKSVDLADLSEELQALMWRGPSEVPLGETPMGEVPQIRTMPRTPTPVSQIVCFLHGVENCRDSYCQGPESPYDVPKSMLVRGYPTFPRCTPRQNGAVQPPDMSGRPLPSPPLPPKNDASVPHIGSVKRSRTFHGRGAKDRKPSVPPKPKLHQPRSRSSDKSNSGTYLDMGLLANVLGRSRDSPSRNRLRDSSRRSENSSEGQPERNHTTRNEEHASPTVGGVRVGSRVEEQPAGPSSRTTPANFNSPRAGGNARDPAAREEGSKDELHCYENVKQAFPTSLACSPKLSNRGARSPSPRPAGTLNSRDPRRAKTPDSREQPPSSPLKRKGAVPPIPPPKKNGQTSPQPHPPPSHIDKPLPQPPPPSHIERPRPQPPLKRTDTFPSQERVGTGKIRPEVPRSRVNTDKDGDDVLAVVRPPGTRGRQPRKFRISGEYDFLRRSSAVKKVNEAEKRRLRMLGLADDDSKGSRQMGDKTPSTAGSQARPGAKGPPPPVPHKPNYRTYVNADAARQWLPPPRVKSSEQLLPSPAITRPPSVLHRYSKRMNARVSLLCRVSKAASDGDQMEEELRLQIQREMEEEEDFQALKKDMMHVLQNSYFFTEVSDLAQNPALFSEDDNDSSDSIYGGDLIGGTRVRRQRSFVTRLSQEPISACVLTRNRSASLPAIRTTELSIPTNVMETHI